MKTKMKIRLAIGFILLIIALYGFSPWLVPAQLSVVSVGPVTIKDIPPYDASRIGISAIFLILGVSVVLTGGIKLKY